MKCWSTKGLLPLMLFLDTSFTLCIFERLLSNKIMYCVYGYTGESLAKCSFINKIHNLPFFKFQRGRLFEVTYKKCW